MNRTDILNAIAAKLPKDARYLEIGVRNPADNFDRIHIADKLGCDPKAPPRADIAKTTSDELFAANSTKFDLIFIDGDHRTGQVLKDLRNSLRAIKTGGYIVMHDCLPISEDEAAPEKPDNSAPWCGGAWAVYAAALDSPKIDAFVVDCDHGVAVIRAKVAKPSLYPQKATPPWEMSKDERNERYNVIQPARLAEVL